VTVDRELVQHIRGLEDEELVEMLTSHVDDYRDEVLAIARSEARSRSLSFEISEPELEPEPEPETVSPSHQWPGDEYQAGGQAVLCSACGHNRFAARAIILSGTELAALVCTKCSHIDLFMQAPARLR